MNIEIKKTKAEKVGFFKRVRQLVPFFGVLQKKWIIDSRGNASKVSQTIYKYMGE